MAGSCTYDPYVLPSIDFVGGSTQDLVFNMFARQGGRPFSMAGCTCNFAVVSFLNKVGTPVIQKEMTIGTEGGGTAENIVSVTLDPGDTVHLSGKYVYQISIRDQNGAVEIPKQGLLYIENNIDKDFITQ